MLGLGHRIDCELQLGENWNIDGVPVFCRRNEMMPLWTCCRPSRTTSLRAAIVPNISSRLPSRGGRGAEVDEGPSS
jgi:hypothetical protein